MLQDVPGLINPIIRSMIENRQIQGQEEDREQRADALKQEATYKQAELKHQQAQLDELTHNHEVTSGLEKQRIDAYKQQLDAQLAHEQIDRLTALIGARGKGADLNKALPPQVQGQVSSPTGIPIPFLKDQNAGIPSQQEQQANEIANIQAKAKAGALGTSQGQAQGAMSPEGTQVFNREQEAAKNKEDRSLQNNMILESMRGADAQTLAGINNAASMSRTRLEGANHLQGIALLHNLGMEDGSLTASNRAKDIVDSIYDLRADPDKLSKDDKQLISTYAPGGFPTGQNYKDYASTVRNLSQVQGIISQARDLAQKYSVDSPGATGKGNAYVRTGIPGIGTQGKLTPGSEADVANEGLATTVGKFIPTLEGSNRQSDQNIARQLVGLYDPKATMQMNQQNINNKAKLINQVGNQSFSGLDPDRVNVALQKRGIVDFGGQNLPSAYKLVKVSPDGTHSIGTNDNGKTWFDVQKGTQIGDVQ